MLSVNAKYGAPKIYGLRLGFIFLHILAFHFKMKFLCSFLKSFVFNMIAWFALFQPIVVTKTQQTIECHTSLFVLFCFVLLSLTVSPAFKVSVCVCVCLMYVYMRPKPSHCLRNFKAWLSFWLYKAFAIFIVFWRQKV